MQVQMRPLQGKALDAGGSTPTTLIQTRRSPGRCNCAQACGVAGSSPDSDMHRDDSFILIICVKCLCYIYIESH